MGILANKFASAVGDSGGKFRQVAMPGVARQPPPAERSPSCPVSPRTSQAKKRPRPRPKLPASAAELKKMAADPTFHVKKIKKLVDQRSTRAYQQAARILADLREALAGTDQAGLAERQALALRAKYPRLNRLLGALREEGFGRK